MAALKTAPSKKRPSSAMEAMESQPTVAFAGLGAMGYAMAGHMAKLPGHQCLVWNRTLATAEQHAKEHGSVAVADVSALASAGVVVLCLPTSAEDATVAEKLALGMAAGSVIVSCTSGEPSATKHLAETLRERHGIHVVDAPVSGGPRGAAAGSLTVMVGADDEAAAERAVFVLQSFARKVVRCGPVGAGHAVKAVNNALNVSHLLLGAEGLLALQRMGVDPAVALEAINGSSGRSLQTEQRLPQEVLTGRFGYGFRLPLMAKDCRIADGLLREGFPSGSILSTAIAMVERSAAEEAADADYTRVVQLLERRAGQQLRSGAEGGFVAASHAAGGSVVAAAPAAKT